MLARLRADSRYLALSMRSKYLLGFAVERYADATGRFWPKLATWAKDASVSRATVGRAITEAVEAKLIEREPYLRPDGMQGSTTYLLALPIASEAATPQGVSTVRRPVQAKKRQGVSTVRQRQGDSTVRHQNASELRKPLSEEEPYRSEGTKQGVSPKHDTDDERLLSLSGEIERERERHQRDQLPAAMQRAREAQQERLADVPATQRKPEWA